MNPKAKAELLPTGTLRVGVNMGNFLLVNKNAEGSLHGVVPDLAQEIARRLGAAGVELLPFPGAGQVADGAKAGIWDIAFIGAEPARATEIAFTSAYLEIPATYLVPAGSKIRTRADVERLSTFDVLHPDAGHLARGPQEPRRAGRRDHHGP